MKKKNNIVKIYTDGACSGNPGPGGYAAIIIHNDRLTEISGFNKQTTNNQMEIQAVIAALQHVAQIINDVKRVNVYTDSEYLIKGITQWINKWKLNNWQTAGKTPVKNKKLWQQLDRYTAKFNTEFIKVKAHNGDDYNERADSLAKKEIIKNT